VTDRAGRIEVGVRRVAELESDGSLPASHPRLMALIRDEIGRDGRMTFARFMEIALYDSEAGYYAAASDGGAADRGPGRTGDFLTAPEGHPIFG